MGTVPALSRDMTLHRTGSYPVVLSLQTHEQPYGPMSSPTDIEGVGMGAGSGLSAVVPMSPFPPQCHPPSLPAEEGDGSMAPASPLVALARLRIN